MRGFFAGAGPRRRPNPKPVASSPPPLSWRELREEAQRTRWLWLTPVEGGYAASMIEVQREWSLDDVLLVVDRMAERTERQERAMREAAEQRRRKA